MDLIVVQVSGAGRGKVQVFDRLPVTIGRDPANDVAFDPARDAEVSGFHAEVVEEAGKPVLLDRGSKGGTYAGGRRSDRITLENGSEVELTRGGPRLRFLLGRTAVLVRESGPDQGKVEVLGPGAWTLGRGRSCDVRFPAQESAVSHSHARLTVRDGDAEIQDLESRNGLLIDGRKEQCARLRDGSIVELGAGGPRLRMVLAGALPGGAILGSTGPRWMTRTVGDVFRGASQAADGRGVIGGAGAYVTEAGRGLARDTAPGVRAVLCGLVAAVLALAVWQGHAWYALADRAGDAKSAALDAHRTAHDARRAAQDGAERAARALAPMRESMLALQADLTRLRAEADKTRAGFQPLIERSRAALVQVIVQRSDGNGGTGTGFCVSADGFIVTNRHVVEGAAEGKVAVLFAHMKGASAVVAEVVRISSEEDADLAVLKVNLPGSLPLLDVWPESAPAQGMEVLALGFPGIFKRIDLEHSGEQVLVHLREPSEANETLATIGWVARVLSDVVLVNCTAFPGSSGSPVLDREGRIVGVMYAMALAHGRTFAPAKAELDSELRGAETVTMLVPAEKVREILRDAGAGR